MPENGYNAGMGAFADAENEVAFVLEDAVDPLDGRGRRTRGVCRHGPHDEEAQHEGCNDARNDHVDCPRRTGRRTGGHRLPCVANNVHTQCLLRLLFKMQSDALSRRGRLDGTEDHRQTFDVVVAFTHGRYSSIEGTQEVLNRRQQAGWSVGCRPTHDAAGRHGTPARCLDQVGLSGASATPTEPSLATMWASMLPVAG